jgi:hypothetical protein
MTADELIAQYIKLRDFKEKRTKELSAELEPYTAAMTAIEGAIFNLMGAQGVTQLKSDAGTAYQKTDTSFKVADPNAFHNWVVEHRLTQFLTAHVSKEAIVNFQEQYPGQLPPGVQQASFTKVQFRRN